ncbi:DUF5677 domain-containing protein [Candidatus Saccharibacteria bacterium oral taxon 955]
MTQSQGYLEDINQLKASTILNLENLLAFSQQIIESTRFKHYMKAKSLIRYNTFSALYQRADSVLALTRINQGNAANVIVRSMWETLIEYDFINLLPSNTNLEIRLASESKQQLTILTDIQEIRAKYPYAETWQNEISDEAISKSIERRRSELLKFNRKYPNVNLKKYSTLHARLKEVDASVLAKNPRHRDLAQFDYRGFYSLLSMDAHSTVIGNAHNSRMHKNSRLEIRLEAPLYESVRTAQLAYTLFLKFLIEINKRQKLHAGRKLKEFKTIDKKHVADYAGLQKKYRFY